MPKELIITDEIIQELIDGIPIERIYAHTCSACGLYRYRRQIVAILKEDLLFRKGIREAVREEIKENGVCILNPTPKEASPWE
jgi:hypothetical protein